jgi:two-component system, LytTR family, sensor kinase
MIHKKYWVCQLMGWGTYGIFETTVNYLSGRDLNKELPFTCIFVLMGIAITHFYRLLVLKKIEWKKLSITALTIRVALASVIVATILAAYMSFQAIVIVKERPTFKFYYFLIFFLNTVLMSLSWNLIYFIWKYIETNTKLTSEKMQMEHTVKDLELKNIKSSLQPHFIFNALNSIKSLIAENPEKAREATTQLSSILRNAIVSDKVELVSLQKELKIVNDYLALECIRYEERLYVQLDIDEKTLMTQIPPLILQTVVENAIKHGIAAEAQGGFIKIKTKYDNADKTVIDIENTGTYLLQNHQQNGGFGLDASHKRLSFFFGNMATLTICNTFQNTVLTTITLPYSK